MDLPTDDCNGGLTAYQVQEKAYAMFDAWLASKPDDDPVHELSLIEQIDVYASQSQEALCRIGL